MRSAVNLAIPLMATGAKVRYRVSEFREAAQEANYYHQKMENDRGEPLPRMPVEKMAIASARRQGAKVKGLS